MPIWLVPSLALSAAICMTPGPAGVFTHATPGGFTKTCWVRPGDDLDAGLGTAVHCSLGARSFGVVAMMTQVNVRRS